MHIYKTLLPSPLVVLDCSFIPNSHAGEDLFPLRLLFIKKKVYLSIWLHCILVAACRIFLVSYRIFHYGMWASYPVACGILVP